MIVTPAFERRHYWLLSWIDNQMHINNKNGVYKLHLEGEKDQVVPGLSDYLKSKGYTVEDLSKFSEVEGWKTELVVKW